MDFGILMFITSKKLSWYKSWLENPVEVKHRRRKILTNRGVDWGKNSSSNAVGARQKASVSFGLFFDLCFQSNTSDRSPSPSPQIRLIVYNALNEQSWPSVESCSRKN